MASANDDLRTAALWLPDSGSEAGGHLLFMSHGPITVDLEPSGLSDPAHSAGRRHWPGRDPDRPEDLETDGRNGGTGVASTESLLPGNLMTASFRGRRILLSIEFF